MKTLGRLKVTANRKQEETLGPDFKAHFLRSLHCSPFQKDNQFVCF